MKTKLNFPEHTSRWLKTAMLACCLVFPARNLFAQTFVPPTMTGTPASGSYYNNTGIRLVAPFSFTAALDQGLHIYTVNYDCLPLNAKLSPSMNYISVTEPRIGGYTDAGPLLNANSCDASQTVQYFDGIGRLVQTVQIKGSPDATKDLIGPHAYDERGREAKNFLRYTTVTDSAGKFQQSALQAGAGQAYFYNHPPTGVKGNANPFSKTVFEPSPLNRPVEQGAPGDPWQPYDAGIAGSGHTVKTSYATNNTTALSDTSNTKRVALYTVTTNSDGSHSLTRGASNTAVYNAGELYVTVTKDENWLSGRAGTTEEYWDKTGNVVLKRAFNFKDGFLQMLSTYYLYDDRNNLAFVLTPKADPDNTVAISSGTLDNLCYQYNYDKRQRLIRKKLPGKGWEFMVYNALDQLVATQDAVQRGKAAQEWIITRYDALGRVTLTGIYQYGSVANQDYYGDVKALVDGFATMWETYTGSSSGYGYDNASFPASISKVLRVNYYDTYGFSGANPYPYGGASTMTKGLLTGSLTNVLGTSDMLWSVHYYDTYGREIRTFEQHYLNGIVSPYNYDERSNSYDFTNALINGVRRHYVKNSANTGADLAVTITNDFQYDHTGKEVKTYSKINNDPKVLISKANYNEVGQLYIKGLHSVNEGASFLQSASLGYNERGWLASSTAPLFGMQLKYNDGTKPQYNGNIAEWLYTGSKSGSKSFTYNYDKLNRLTMATSYAGDLDETIGYDVMGNITDLTRTGQSYGTLSYGYLNSGQSNQLSTVTGTGFTSRSYAYDENGNATSDGETKAISYNMLNLPSFVKMAGTTVATYTYDASGKKLRNTGSDGNWDYIDGIVYKNGAINFIGTPEGRAVPSGGSYNYEYNLQDHLGNNRVSFDNNNGTARVLQEEEYYSFGLRKNTFGITNGNRYLYNGKEIQTDLTNQYDYGARFYDPVIARWTSVDPKAELDRRWSPYVYGFDNPIRFEDPDGMWPGEGFLSDAWSSAKSSFKGYFTSAYNTVRHPINTAKALYNSAKQMSAGELITAPIRNSPGVKMITAEVTAVKALIKGDGKAFGGVVGNQVANTTAVLATAGAGAVAGKATSALSEIGIANPVPSTVARVVPIMENTPTTLGAPGASDVFVTSGGQLNGLNAAQIAQKLTIPQSPTGFNVFEFPTPEGISTPINRTNPGFIGGGRTAGGAPEFTIPNGPIPANATKTTIPPGQ